jgi:hypothetical protein
VRASAIVAVSCPFCGPVELPTGTLTCGVGPDGSSPGLCEFTCPFCSRLVFLATDQAAAHVLLGSGARPFAGPAPFELLEVHRGAPLAYDDILEFHAAISAAPFPQEEVMSPGHQEEVVSLGDQEVVSVDDEPAKRGPRIRRLRTRRRHDRTER